MPDIDNKVEVNLQAGECLLLVGSTWGVAVYLVRLAVGLEYPQEPVGNLTGLK